MKEIVAKADKCNNNKEAVPMIQKWITTLSKYQKMELYQQCVSHTNTKINIDLAEWIYKLSQN